MLRRNFLKCMSVAPLATLVNTNEKPKIGLPNIGDKWPFLYKVTVCSEKFNQCPRRTIVDLDGKVVSSWPLYKESDTLNCEYYYPTKDKQVYLLENIEIDKLSQDLMCYHRPTKRLITSIQWERVLRKNNA